MDKKTGISKVMAKVKVFSKVGQTSRSKSQGKNLWYHVKGFVTRNKQMKYDSFFSLLRQENPPILMSGEMLSHPGGWDKPIPEVIHLRRHRMSTPNNLEKSRLVGVLDIFCTFLDKNEKNNQTPHWGRDSGIPSSCPRFATSTTQQASSWITNLGHLDGIPSSLPQCGVRFY